MPSECIRMMEPTLSVNNLSDMKFNWVCFPRPCVFRFCPTSTSHGGNTIWCFLLRPPFRVAALMPVEQRSFCPARPWQMTFWKVLRKHCPLWKWSELQLTKNQLMVVFTAGGHSCPGKWLAAGGVLTIVRALRATLSFFSSHLLSSPVNTQFL